MIDSRGDDAEGLARAECALEWRPGDIDRHVPDEARTLAFHAVRAFHDPSDHRFARRNQMHVDVWKNWIWTLLGGFCGHDRMVALTGHRGRKISGPRR